MKYSNFQNSLKKKVWGIRFNKVNRTLIPLSEFIFSSLLISGVASFFNFIIKKGLVYGYFMLDNRSQNLIPSCRPMKLEFEPMRQLAILLPNLYPIQVPYIYK